MFVSTLAVLLLATVGQVEGMVEGVRLKNKEFSFIDLEGGQRVKFAVNPKIDQAISVRQITDYEYHHLPRAADPTAFQNKMAAVFGGHETSTIDRAHRVHTNAHADAWSLIEAGESKKAGLLLHAHENGDMERVELIRSSTAHVHNTDYQAKHVELQRTILMEEMNHALRVGSTDHAFSLVTTKGKIEGEPAGAGSQFKCEFSCKGCNAKLDLSLNGPCRIFGCGSLQCRAVAANICKDPAKFPNANPSGDCADTTTGKEEDQPICVKPCAMTPDPYIADMDKMESQTPNFWAKAMSSVGEIRPQLRLYGCVQADIDLLALTGVPAIIQLGIMGKISYNTGDKCFGWGVDAALGVFFGVKVGGLSLGISINLIGSLSLDEMPYEGGADEADFEKIEDMAGEANGEASPIKDHRPVRVEGECPGRKPFELWSAFADKMYKGLSRDAVIQKKIKESIKKVKESEGYTAFQHYEVANDQHPDMGRYPLADIKMDSDDDEKAFATIETKNKRVQDVFGEVGVVQSFRALMYTAQNIEHKMARFSAHAMRGLQDTDDVLLNANKKTKNMYRLSTGRFLARAVTGSGQALPPFVPCYKLTLKADCTGDHSLGACEWKQGITGKIDELKKQGESAKKDSVMKQISLYQQLKGYCVYKAGEEEKNTPMTRTSFKWLPKDKQEEEKSAEEEEADEKASKGKGPVKEVGEDPKGDQPASDTKKRGAAGAGNNFDDRVINLPRAMRKSWHNNNMYFWRNAAISTANFFVRYIGDMQAIFNLYFAGSPNWDGDCHTLPGRHTLMYEGASGIGDFNAISHSQCKNNDISAEGPEIPDEDLHWYSRHWMSSKKVKAGENGKATCDWVEACIHCPRDDIPAIIYPTPICLSISEKLATGDPEVFKKHRKINRPANEALGLAASREDKDYVPDFFAASHGAPPSGVEEGKNGGFMLAFDKTCNVQWGETSEKYWECEKN